MFHPSWNSAMQQMADAGKIKKPGAELQVGDVLCWYNPATGETELRTITHFKAAEFRNFKNERLPGREAFASEQFSIAVLDDEEVEVLAEKGGQQ